MITIINHINSILFFFIPETRCYAFKRFMLRLAGVTVGRNVRISSSVKLYGAGKLEIGENTWIGPLTFIATSSLVKIGANVDIGPRVYIGTGSHRIDPKGNRVAGEGISKDVTIEKGAWLCAGCIVLPGVTIGELSVIAAGSVVNRDVQQRCVYGGIPANFIKTI